MKQTGQYGRWDSDREGTKATENRREALAQSGPVTDGDAEMSRCERLCLCLSVCAVFVSVPTVRVTLR